MSAETINNLAIIPALTATTFALAAAIVYVTGSRGSAFTSLLGVSFLGILVAALPFMAVPILRRIYGEYPGYPAIAWILYTLAAILYFFMLVAILVEQHRGAAPVSPSISRKVSTMSNNELSTVAAVVDGKPTTVDPATGTPTAIPTAKVLTTAAVSLGLVVVVAILNAITPDLLGFAGAWAPVLFAGIVALAGSLAGYIKRP